MRGFPRHPDGHLRLVQGSARARLCPALAQTEAYWLALRGAGQRLPARAQFHPRGLGDILDRLLLLERIAPGQLRIRLAGHTVADAFGLTPQGMPLTALIHPHSRGAIAARCEEAFLRPAIALLHLRAEGSCLRLGPRAQLMLLPMNDAQGAPTRALACLATESPILSHKPQRFSLESGEFREIPPAAEARPEAMPQTAAPQRPRFAEKNAPVPWLRLVKG